MVDDYLPPVVINITGTDKGFLATLAEDKALLLDFAKQVTQTQLGASSAQFQTDLGAVKTELLDFAKQLTTARLGATAEQFWTQIAALRAEISAMSPVDINVDANVAAAMAQIAALKAELAGVQTDNLVDAGLGGLLESAAGGGGGGGAAGLLSALGWGGGKGLFGMLGGMASFGSILSLMGFGAEHVAATGIGVAGSLAGAGLGAGFLGLGMAGTGAVGMGTDLAGIGQAAGDIQTYIKLKGALTQAASVYGKTSVEYKTAEYQYQQWASFLTKTTIAAVAKVSQTLTKLHTIFDSVTAMAETKGAEIITSLANVAMKYLPIIGRFATQNMSIIMKALQPFEKWLDTSGKSGGLGIFTSLEKIFQSELPAGMQALEQGFELLAKTITIAAKAGGGFIKWISTFLTRMNGATFGKWSHFVTDMITSFNAWFGVLRSGIGLFVALFQPAVGLGDDIARLLTQIFGQITGWLKGTHNILHGLFTAHAKELITGIGGIIKAALPIVEQFTDAFVTFATGGAVVATTMLKGIAAALRVIDKIPFASQVMGWGLALAFFGPKVATGLVSILTQLTLLPTRVGVFALNFVQGFTTAGSAVVSFVGNTAGMLATWGTAVAKGVATVTAKFAVMVARWVAGAATWIATNVAMAASATETFIAENAATLGIIAGLAALVAAAIYVGTHWHQVWSDIKNWFDDAVKFLRSGFGTLVVLIAGPIAPLLLLALHWQQVWTGIKGVASAVGSFFTSTFVNFFIDMGHDIESAWDATVGFFEALPSHIENFFEALPGDMMNIGEDLINGLVHGVENGAQDAVNAVKNVGRDILHGIKSFLGIFSPSTVMTTVGTTTMQGLTNGINAGSQETVAAATNAAKAIVKAFGSMQTVKTDTSAITGIKSMMTSLSSVLQSLSSIAGTAGQLNFGAIVGSIQTLAANVPTLASALKSLQPALASLGKLTPVTKGLSTLQTAVTKLQSVLNSLTSVTQKTVKSNIPVAFFAMDVAIGQITSTVPTFLNALHGLQLDLQNMGKLKTSSKSLTTLKSAFTKLANFLKELTATVKTVAGVNIPGAFFGMDLALTEIQDSIPTFSSALDAMKKALNSLGKITTVLKGLTGLKKMFKSFGTALTALSSTVKTIGAANIPQDFNTLATAAGQIASGLKTTWGKIKSDSSSTWKDISNYIKKVTTTVLTPLKNLATKVKGVGTDLKNAWTKILSDMKVTWGQITSFVQSLPGKLGSPFKGIKTEFATYGVQMMQGLQAGIESGTAGVVTAMQTSIAQAVTAAKKAAKISSPSRLMSDEVGLPMGLGVATGILRALGEVQSSSRALVAGGVVPTGGFGLGLSPAPGAAINVTFGNIMIQGGSGTPAKTAQAVKAGMKDPIDQLISRLNAGSTRA